MLRRVMSPRWGRRAFLDWAPNVSYLNKWSDNSTLNEWVLDRINLFQVGCVLLLQLGFRLIYDLRLALFFKTVPVPT